MHRSHYVDQLVLKMWLLVLTALAVVFALKRAVAFWQAARRLGCVTVPTPGLGAHGRMGNTATCRVTERS